MKRKLITFVIVLALCAGIGVFLLTRFRSQSPSSAAEKAGSDSPPTVVSVQVGALKRMTLRRSVEAYGLIIPAPATTNQPAAGAPLAPPAAGVVARVDVIEGQAVKKGDVLIELNSGASSVDFAQQELARQEKLFAEQNTSLKSLQTAQAQLAGLRVVAPLSGTVTHLNVRLGQAVDVTSVVAELADLSRLAVTASVPISDVNEMKVGDALQLLANPPVATELSFISPTVDTNNNTVSIRGMLAPNSGLRLGQFVPVRIVTGVHSNCLAAPEVSVVTDISGHSVLELVHGDQAIQAPVQTGFRDAGWVEVDGPGLKEGDQIVTVGAYGLPEKTKVSIANPPGAEKPGNNSSPSEAR